MKHLLSNQLKAACLPAQANRSRLANSAGVSNLGVLLVVLIIVVCGYTAAQIFPIYYGYWELQAQFESMTEKAAIKDDDEIRDFLWDQMRMQKINATRDDLKISRRNRTITIELDYVETFSIPWLEGEEKELHDFEFSLYAEDEF